MEVTKETKAIREQSGVPIRDVAREMGYKNQSGWQHYENPDRFRRKWLPPQIIEKMLPIFVGKHADGQPPVTSDQILRLGGPSLIVHGQERHLLSMFRKATPAQRQIVLNMLEELLRGFSDG